jgi:hypothetical protein
MVVILNLLNGLNNLKRNKMKQTALEWFEDQVGHNSLMGLKEFNEIFEKAKEMEKEQISIAYKEGWSCPHGEGFPETGEQYYNKTYESK